MSLRTFKKIYDFIGNDTFRARVLHCAELFHARKDILRMDVNDVCNIECIMCCNKPRKCTEGHYMPLGQFKQLMDRMSKSIRFLYLSCSYEPLVTPDFIEYIAYARSKGIPFISFVTNGLLLKEKIIKKLVALKINEVIISFNGFDKDDYNRIMFRSNYDRVTKNLKILKEYKRNVHSLLPKVRLNAVLMKSNLEKFDKLTEFIKQYCIDTVQFREFQIDARHNNNFDENRKERIENIDSDTLKSIVKKINDEAKEFVKEGRQFIIPASLADSEMLAGEQSISSKKSCTIPFFSYWVDFKGNIKICCGENADSNIGNIFKDSEVGVQKKRKSFRKIALSGKCAMNCKMNADSSKII